MRRCLLHVLLATSLAGAASGQNVVRTQVSLPTNGVVEYPGDPVTGQIRVDLRRPSGAPLGATLRTYRLFRIGSRQVGRLTGVFRVVRSEWPVAWANPVPSENAGLAGFQIGDAIEIDDPDQASVVRIEAFASGGEDSVRIGANVYWEKQFIGRTPLSVEVVPGNHVFRLEEPGFESLDLPLVVNRPLILDTVAGLQPAQRAADLYNRGRVAFFEGRYAQADSLIGRANQNSDGSLAMEQVVEGPMLRDAAGLAVQLAERARGTGLPEERVHEAGSLIFLILDVRSRDVPRARVHLAELAALVPGDPILDVLETKLREGRPRLDR